MRALDLVAVIVFLSGCHWVAQYPAVATSDASTIDASTIDASTVDAPTIDASTVDAPTVDAPTIDASTIDASTIDASTIDASTIDASTIDASTIDAPNRDLSSDVGRLDVLNSDGDTAPTLGLVAHWSFDEGGGDIAADSSGNDHHATLFNMEADDWIGGVKGTALNMSVDDYVQYSCEGCPGQPYAVSFWFRANTLAGSLFCYAVGGFSGGVQKTIAMHGSYLHTGPSKLRKGLALSELKVGVWHHLVANYSGTVIQVYLDGLDKTVDTDDYWNAGSFSMGRRVDEYSALQYDGALDEVRLYSRTLTFEEVHALFQHGM
ncbi:MAG: LamG domain-containing protein [Deltaproteobacteria bacterium]|nr:LamG domain-containing protein [Deltaproteobacteria bacterium]